MNTKILIILIILIALGVGGFFVYQNISAPELEEGTPATKEKTEMLEDEMDEQTEKQEEGQVKEETVLPEEEKKWKKWCQL